MKKSDAIILLLSLTMAAPAAFPEPPKSRDEALTALKSDDAATRAEAVVWIAHRGGPADDGLLHERHFAQAGLRRSLGAGMVHVQLEQFDQALGWFRRALDVNPNMIGVELMINRIASKSKLQRMRYRAGSA